MARASPYLEVTLARRPGDAAARTECHGSWLVDYAPDGRAIGIEFPSVGTIDLAELNRLLAATQHPALTAADVVPLVAA